MPTNILALPLYEVEVETASNEDALGGFSIEAGSPPAPLSLAGIDFRMQLRTSADSKNVQLEATIANGRLSAAGHLLGVAIDQVVMAGLPPRDYAFDVLAVADGVERRLMFGVWRHKLGVTTP